MFFKIYRNWSERFGRSVFYCCSAGHASPLRYPHRRPATTAAETRLKHLDMKQTHSMLFLTALLYNVNRIYIDMSIIITFNALSIALLANRAAGILWTDYCGLEFLIDPESKSTEQDKVRVESLSSPAESSLTLAPLLRRPSFRISSTSCMRPPRFPATSRTRSAHSAAAPARRFRSAGRDCEFGREHV